MPPRRNQDPTFLFCCSEMGDYPWAPPFTKTVVKWQGNSPLYYAIKRHFEYSSASGPSKYNLPILLPPNSNQNMLFVKLRYKLFYSEYDLNSSDCVIKFA